jgi:ribosomal protein L12E/L44/L45/RPP1/RPP2
MVTEEAEWVKMYALFRRLSDVHKREILKKAEALVSAGPGKTAKEDRKKRVKEKP